MSFFAYFYLDRWTIFLFGPLHKKKYGIVNQPSYACCWIFFSETTNKKKKCILIKYTLSQIYVSKSKVLVITYESRNKNSPISMMVISLLLLLLLLFTNDDDYKNLLYMLMMVEKRRIHSYFRVLVFLCVCVCLKSQKNKNKIKSPTIIGSQMYTIIIQYNVAIVMTSNGKKTHIDTCISLYVILDHSIFVNFFCWLNLPDADACRL